VITFLVSCGNDSNGKVLKVGDKFTISGMVTYSEEPSDIGQRYCAVAGDVEFEYIYTDIYEEKSKWSSKEFFTKDDEDTDLLKKYEGKEVTVSGVFDAESHGVPYITNIEITEGEN
jgi:hypothetical protein